MAPLPGDEHAQLLDSVDRISEVLVGLIMAVTIVGSLSIATAGMAEVRPMLAALGCNLAWGLIVTHHSTPRRRLWRRAKKVRETVYVVEGCNGGELG